MFHTPFPNSNEIMSSSLPINMNSRSRDRDRDAVSSASSFSARQGYSLLSELGEADVQTEAPLLGDQVTRSSLISRGCVSFSLSSESSSSNHFEDAKLFDIDNVDYFSLASFGHCTSSSCIDSSRHNVTFEELPNVTFEELPNWEGSLYFPLSLYHFNISLQHCTALDIVNGVSQFLDAHDSVSYQFNLSNFKWECALFDDTGVVKFDINILLDDQKGEIIIEWNKLRGNSGAFTKLFKQNHSSFQSQFKPYATKFDVDASSTITTTTTAATTTTTFAKDILPLPFEDSRDFSEKSFEQLQSIMSTDAVSAIIFLVAIISFPGVSENSIVDTTLEQFNKVVSAQIQSLHNGGKFTDHTDFLLLQQYSETYLLCLGTIKARILNLLSSSKDRSTLTSKRFLEVIQNTFNISNALYKLCIDKNVYINPPSEFSSLSTQTVPVIFDPIFRRAHCSLHRQISKLLTPEL